MRITYHMTEEQFKNEISMAGSPNKIIALMNEIHNLMVANIDTTNAAEIINTSLMLRRLNAELKLWLKMLSDKTGQKYEKI